MTLYMQKNPSSWPDRFTIKDEFGIDRYFVEGERFTWGKPLHVFDMENREVALVKRKLFAFYPIFEVYVNDSLALAIKFTYEVNPKRTFLYINKFLPKILIEGMDWTVDGIIYAHRYVILGPQGNVASIDQVLLGFFRSESQIDIAVDKNEVLVLATVLAIDYVNKPSMHISAGGM